jgi:hypothetical protein
LCDPWQFIGGGTKVVLLLFVIANDVDIVALRGFIEETSILLLRRTAGLCHCVTLESLSVHQWAEMASNLLKPAL